MFSLLCWREQLCDAAAVLYSNRVGEGQCRFQVIQEQGIETVSSPVWSMLVLALTLTPYGN
jgi:hypothetical protein